MSRTSFEHIAVVGAGAWGVALANVIVRVVAASVETGRHDAILLAVPSQHLRAAATMIAPALAKGTPVIACAKGIERGTRKFMTEVIAQSAPAALPAILSGPSFAGDVARGLPTAVTLA